jgi:hypothetical protein
VAYCGACFLQLSASNEVCGIVTFAVIKAPTAPSSGRIGRTRCSQPLLGLAPVCFVCVWPFPVVFCPVSVASPHCHTTLCYCAFLSFLCLLWFCTAGKELKVAEIAKFKLENDLRKERESLSAVETMLSNYKEEVFTLNEALKIAALDIAEIAQGEEDDDNYVLNDTLNTLQQTLSVQESKGHVAMAAPGDEAGARAGAGTSTNAEQVHRHVRDDAAAFSQQRAAAGGGGATFVVSTDGSFVHS